MHRKGKMYVDNHEDKEYAKFVTIFLNMYREGRRKRKMYLNNYNFFFTIFKLFSKFWPTLLPFLN
jgi:hypothetical protein